MRNLLAGVACAVILLAGCRGASPASDDANIKAELPAMPPMPASIQLPPFPDFPAPQSSLSADQTGVIYYPSKSPYDYSVLIIDYDTALPTTGKGTLILPDGASADNPVPAMVVIPGSGGIAKGREMEYAALFAKNGIASFVIDYYAPRGADDPKNYQLRTLSASEIDIVTDAFNVLKVVGSHPAIDASRIGVTGYSYGGMATRYTLDPRLHNIIAPDVPPFALHMDLYGPCHQSLSSGKTTGAPYLAIYGDNDNSVSVKACVPVQAAIKAGGSSVERHIMPGAGHAWDNAKERAESPYPYIKGECKFTYDQDSGDMFIDGKPGPKAAPGASRSERALLRTQVPLKCIGMGYIVGSDPATDKKAKGIQLAFMKKHFGL